MTKIKKLFVNKDYFWSVVIKSSLSRNQIMSQSKKRPRIIPDNKNGLKVLISIKQILQIFLERIK